MIKSSSAAQAMLIQIGEKQSKTKRVEKSKEKVSVNAP
jgi:hypothetical protein